MISTTVTTITITTITTGRITVVRWIPVVFNDRIGIGDTSHPLIDFGISFTQPTEEFRNPHVAIAIAVAMALSLYCIRILQQLPVVR